MSVSDDDLEPGGWAPRTRIEIGPAPTGDHTGLWIRIGLTAMVGLVVWRVTARIRRAR